MKAKKVVLATALVLFQLPVAALELDKNLEFEAGDYKKLLIDAGAGSLRVTGDEGDTVRVRAHIRIDADSDEDAKAWMEETMKLGFSSSGSKITLDGHFDSGRRGNILSGLLDSLDNRVDSATIDLVVTMPAGLDLDVDDGSGHTVISNINGDLWVDDGSGDLEISAIGGNVEIDDGSGDLLLKDIGGNLEVDDGSGNLVISGVRGAVEIDDGSGNLEVSRVTGNVRIDDGSGDIVAKDLEQDLIIEDGGSGGLRTERIAGRIVNRD